MPHSLNVIGGFFVVLDESEVEKFNCPVTGARYFPDYESESISFGYGEKEQLFGGQTFQFIKNGIVQLREGLPNENPPLDFLNFNAIVLWCRNNLGFSLISATLPGASIQFNTAIVIQSLAQLNADPDTGDIVPPFPVTHYIIDAINLDMEGVRFVNAPGTLTIVSSLAPGGASLINNEDNYTMFTGNGSLYLLDITLSVTGTNSQVIDMENEPAGRNLIYFERNTFDGCTKIGTFTDYQIVWQSGRITACSDGMTLDGANSFGFSYREIGVESSQGIFLQATPTYRCLDRGYVEAVRWITNIGDTFLSFIPANFPNSNSFFVKETDISGAGAFVSGITAGDVRCNWSENHGALAENTYAGIHAVNDSDQTTPGVDIGTFTPMVCDWNVFRSDWFQSDGLGGFTYISTTPTLFSISGSFSIEGGLNTQYIVALGVTPDGGVVEILQQMPATTSISIGLTGQTENNAFVCEHLFQYNDYIRPYFSKTVVSSSPILLQYSSLRFQRVK